MVGVPEIVAGAIVLYAVIYLTRYIRAALKGKSTGCGCGSQAGCPKSEPDKAEGPRAGAESDSP